MRIEARVAVKVAWQRQDGVGFAAGFRCGIQRAFEQCVHAHMLVHNLVHKRRVRTVFQQAAHQIGQQGFMCADRGVHANAPTQVLFAHHLVVQRFAHAVQALVLEIFAFTEVVNAGKRVGVVCCKLREHGVLRFQQFARACQIGNVGVHFACVYRIAVHAVHLRPFDFAVPICAFHQANHEFLVVAARQVHQIINHERAAFLIRLHHKTDAVEAGQIGVGHQGFHQIQRQFQAVGFFGVNVQADVVLFGEQEQFFQTRQQFFHHAFVLRARITRMNGGEFHRNTVAFVHACAVGIFADGVNRLHIIVEITLRVGFGHGRFAQHIEREAVAHFFALFAVGQCFFNGLAGHELFAQHTHGRIHTGADQRCAAFAQQAAQTARQSFFVRFVLREFAGNQQAPCGGIHKHGRAASQVAFPVAVCQFVLNQFVARFFIGNTQQGFGQAHQRHAFFAGQCELLHQCVHTAGFAAVGTHFFHQRARQLVCSLLFFSAHRRALQHVGNGFLLVAAVGGGNGLAQGVGLGLGKGKHDFFP